MKYKKIFDALLKEGVKCNSEDFNEECNDLMLDILFDANVDNDHLKYQEAMIRTKEKVRKVGLVVN